MSIPTSMKAVVFNGPFDVSTEERPVPKLEAPTDALLKVHFSGLCGTDLHSYRGHIKGAKGQIIGHEFTGEIIAIGDEVKSFKVGDEVLSTFTIQCGKCWYCLHGYSGQCDKTNTFGKPGLDGGQAEYVRIPYADSTLFPKPASTSSEVDDSVYVLMADIFVTGYYGVKKILDQVRIEAAAGLGTTAIKDVSILQLGCGPVGLCALKIAKHLGFQHIVVVDNVPSRLAQAVEWGASHTINFETGQKDALKTYIEEHTGGVGFDAVLEVVGTSNALRTAFDSVRRNGFISSLGMAHEELPFNGLECYLKNANMSFGRCHVRSLFPEALEIFELMKADFANFIDHKVGIDEAKASFELFDSHKVNKVVFDMNK